MKYVQWFEAINESKVNVNEKVKVYSEIFVRTLGY